MQTETTDKQAQKKEKLDRQTEHKYRNTGRKDRHEQ